MKLSKVPYLSKILDILTIFPQSENILNEQSWEPKTEADAPGWTLTRVFTL
jgi:hypothetical protein